MPQRRLHPLPEREGPELAVPRRVRGIGDGAEPMRWPAYRRSSPMPKPPRWAAPASRPTTRCATPRRCPATGSRSSASAGSAISACSSPGRWVSRPSRSLAAPPKRRMPGSWALITTSTPPPVTSPKRCRRWAARRSSWAPRRTPRPWLQTVGGLLPQGELVTIGVTAEPLPISPLQLITPGLSIVGHPSGTAKDVEDTMHFAVLVGRADVDRGAAAGAGRRGLCGDGAGASALPHRFDHVNTVGL